jgi:Dolichyl-phosphate-mannose-protein mannosyltransferase
LKPFYEKNSWAIFAPFLFAYLLMIYKLNSQVPYVFMGDEPRYFQYAHHLLQGYFSSKGEVDLWSGPGYPLFLAAFLKLGLNVVGLRLLNAILQYASIVVLFKTLQFCTTHKKAFWISLTWAFYYIAYKEMLYLYTEPLTCLLIVLIAYSILKLNSIQQSSVQKYFNIIITGILIGYLALVKIIFGYVILFCFILFLIIYLIKRKTIYAQFALVFIIAIITTSPYLNYTHQITNRYFYWGNSGGMSLYWMSTPVEKEYGDWNDDKFRAYCDFDSTMPCNADLFAKNHQSDYDAIYKLKGVERDDAFKLKAIQNIKANPLKYFKNILANGCRLFFSIPNSYQPIRKQNIFRMLPNVFVFLIFIYCITFSVLNFKKLTPTFLLLLSILCAYLGATLLVSAQQRQLYVVLPLILILFAWIREQLTSFGFRLLN